MQAQLSPGDLTFAHKNLEGLKNCMKCHVLGKQIRNQECLACHTEIKSRIDSKKGYHASADVQGKNCFSCHSEHHGRNFRIINFDPKTFNHSKAGFTLTGKHSQIKCEECHKKDFISDATLKKRSNTYLGLKENCNSCHTDVHKGTLGNTCDKCHTTDKFKPATKFDHNKAKFVLTGAHKTVECVKCHAIETLGGKKFQKFAGVAFQSCTSCHKDFHQGKFGINCESCHVTESFTVIKNLKTFDHGKTEYLLTGMHINVKCNDCHKNNYKTKLQYDRCYRCHDDYHKGQFTKNEVQTDCDQCHSLNADYKLTSYTIEKHNTTKFKLEGSHLAVPCENCHLFGKEWKFRIDDARCVSCHKNVHGESISNKIKADKNCELCHNVESWNSVKFDHKSTGYELLGKHLTVSCTQCHKPGSTGLQKQLSFTTKSDCVTCHKDIHFGQFAENGKVDCQRCHVFDDWKPLRFDHSKARFALDGAHQKVPCAGCHKQVTSAQGNYINYKYEASEIKCATCHS